MAGEIVERLEKISVNEVEEEVLELGDEGSTVGAGFDKRCCLIGKVLTDKTYSVQGFKKAMAGAWKPRRRVDFQDLENNLYLIHFEHITDMKRIMEDGPWLFDRDLVVLKTMQGDE